MIRYNNADGEAKDSVCVVTFHQGVDTWTSLRGKEHACTVNTDLRGMHMH